MNYIHILDGFLTQAECYYMMDNWLDVDVTEVERESAPPRAMDLGGPYSYSAANRTTLEKSFQNGYVGNLYRRVLMAVRRYVPEAIESPHYDSSVTLKVFEEGDHQGWHYDTNPVSALLCFSEPLGGQTEFADGTILPSSAGRLAIFSGRGMLHRALPVTQGIKVNMPLNYYYPWDTFRPEGIDGVIYG